MPGLQPPADGEWFEHRDERRTLLLFAGAVSDPLRTLSRERWSKFELLSTERALGEAPELRGAAERVHLVPPGPVPDAAAAVLDDVGSGLVGHYVATTRIAVTRALSVATGRKTFQPSAMSWS